MGAVNAGVGYATPAAVLDRVLDEVLVSADDWCQGAAAKDAKGVPVATDYEGAVSFCMVGAIKRATALELGLTGDMQNQYPFEYWDLMAKASDCVLGLINHHYRFSNLSSIPWVNDAADTTFEDVRLIFKQAREAAS